MLKTALLLLFVLFGLPLPGLASETAGSMLDLTAHPLGLFALALFVAAYALVIFEEQLHLRKSKPVMLAAGIIWVLVALTYAALGDTHTPHDAIKHRVQEEE